MKAIYEPKGRALEYAKLACNLYRGCTHGCTYCYAPAVLRMSRGDFHEWSVMRSGVLEALGRDAAKLAGDPRRVLLCFTCDPYAWRGIHRTTREAIEVLHRHDLGVEILTKGGHAAEKDFDLLGPKDRVGASLTLLDWKDSEITEPNAATPEQRIGMLRAAKERGLGTFASMEPVIKEDQTLALIKMAAPYVDLFKVGKWNHAKEANLIDWKKFGSDAVELLEKLGKKYYIKEDLAKAMS